MFRIAHLTVNLADGDSVEYDIEDSPVRNAWAWLKEVDKVHPTVTSVMMVFIKRSEG